jgi:hypothetical protein
MNEDGTCLDPTDWKGIAVLRRCTRTFVRIVGCGGNIAGRESLSQLL